MPTDCPACGAELVPGRGDDELRCERCGARVRAPRESFDDRPRRRRRRSPPSGGSGRVLLVLAALGLLLILGCGGVVAVVFLAGGPQWREHRSATGGYTVDLPAAPRPDMAQIAAKHGPLQPGVTYEGTILLGRLEEYSIVFMDIAPDVRAANTDDQLLDLTADGIKNADPPARIRSSKNMTVSGYPGRELEIDLGGQHLLARVVVTRTKLYTVISGGPLTAANEPRVRRFVESFKLTDPRPADAAPADDEPVPRKRR